jgi:hypothetical protein
MCGQAGESSGVAPWQPPDPSQVDTASYWPESRGPSQRDVNKAASQLRWAWLAVAFVGSVNVALAAIAGMGVPLLQRYLGWGAALEGGVYLILAFFIWRRSLIALGIATVLLLIDAVVVLLVVHQFAGIVLRAAILYAVFQGFYAIDVLKKHRAAEGISDQPRAA